MARESFVLLAKKNGGGPGEFQAVELTADGAIPVGVVGGGSAGPVDQGAAGTEAWPVTDSAAATLAETVGTTNPAQDAPAINVRNVQAMTLTTAAPPEGTLAQAVHPISPGGQLPDADSIDRFVVIPAPGSQVKAEQGLGDRGGWFVRGTDGVTDFLLASQDGQQQAVLRLDSVITALGLAGTEVTQAQVLATLVDVLTELTSAAKETTLANIETLLTARLPALVGGKIPVDATGSTVGITGTVGVTAAGGAPLALDSSVDTLEANTDQIESKLGTLAAQEATTAKDTSVDGLEALATTGNASLASIDGKTAPRVGATIASPHGTATTTSAPLPSGSYPDGFTLINLDPTKTIWYKQGGVASAANGVPVFPESEDVIPLVDPSVVQVVVTSGTADWVIKAVT